MPLFRFLLRYISQLSTGRTILWCYAIWYIVTVATHFDPRPRIWLTSIGLSAIIGTALIISTQTAGKARVRMDHWVVFRLFLMPFCVSSFSALVKDAGYILIFPPSWPQIATGCAGILFFLTVVTLVKLRSASSSSGSP